MIFSWCTIYFPLPIASEHWMFCSLRAPFIGAQEQYVRSEEIAMFGVDSHRWKSSCQVKRQLKALSLKAWPHIQAWSHSRRSHAVLLQHDNLDWNRTAFTASRMFLYILSWVAMVFHIIFLTFALGRCTTFVTPSVVRLCSTAVLHLCIFLASLQLLHFIISLSWWRSTQSWLQKSSNAC